MTSSYDSALIDSALIDDPRLTELPRNIRFLHIEALVWSKQRRTDGYIPAASLARLTDESDPRQAADELQRVGLWAMTDSGWRIVDYLDSQMSAARVRAKQEAARERYDRWQQAHPQGKRVGNGVTNDPARPAPPARKGGGQVGGNGAGLWEPASAAVQEVPHPQIQSPTRRDVARWIREAPNPSLKRAHVSAFRRTWGHLYPARPGTGSA